MLNKMSSFCSSLAMKRISVLPWHTSGAQTVPDGGQFGAVAEDPKHHFSERPRVQKQKGLRVPLGQLMLSMSQSSCSSEG